MFLKFIVLVFFSLYVFSCSFENKKEQLLDDLLIQKKFDQAISLIKNDLSHVDLSNSQRAQHLSKLGEIYEFSLKDFKTAAAWYEKTIPYVGPDEQLKIQEKIARLYLENNNFHMAFVKYSILFQQPPILESSQYEEHFKRNLDGLIESLSKEEKFEQALKSIIEITERSNQSYSRVLVTLKKYTEVMTFIPKENHANALLEFFKKAYNNSPKNNFLIMEIVKEMEQEKNPNRFLIDLLRSNTKATHAQNK